MEDRNVRRGDIYHADLDPVFGSEQGGYQMCIRDRHWFCQLFSGRRSCQSRTHAGLWAVYCLR